MGQEGKETWELTEAAMGKSLRSKKKKRSHTKDRIYRLEAYKLWLHLSSAERFIISFIKHPSHKLPYWMKRESHCSSRARHDPHQDTLYTHVNIYTHTHTNTIYIKDMFM